MKPQSKNHPCEKLVSPDLNKKVAVLIGYFNGERYIKEQIESLLTQSIGVPDLFLLDDCSSEPVASEIVEMLNEKKVASTVIRRKKNEGFSRNFLKGLAEIPQNYSYYAFCDQDDVWLERKLEAAILRLSEVPTGVPAIYCGRTMAYDAECKKFLKYSPEFKKRPSFQNALVQNIGGGNTMVLNKAARDLVALTAAPVVSHDWWCYQIVTGVGGYVIYDKIPYLKYRQHRNNLIGVNTGVKARLSRIRRLFNGEFRDWNNINLVSLKKFEHMLIDEASRCLFMFTLGREASFRNRLFFILKSGVHRQSSFENFAFALAVLFRKV
ncbi:glycosyltransferase [Alphaproteobacteria bacterium]|nr:glycosyltransferase [Alphaproteobacteria bacterium]